VPFVESRAGVAVNRGSAKLQQTHLSRDWRCAEAMKPSHSSWRTLNVVHEPLRFSRATSRPRPGPRISVDSRESHVGETFPDEIPRLSATWGWTRGF